MYLLKRTISPYTGSDLLLGCYRNLHEAQEAREYYILRYKNNEKDDPWKGQAYHQVDLNQDVVILDNIPELAISLSNSDLFIISSFAEGFGQVIRNFHAICGTENAAHSKAREVKKSFTGNFPEDCQIDKIVLNQLLPDNKDRRTFADDLRDVKNLKKSKSFRELESLLIDFVVATEAESTIFDTSVAPWYYSELAKLYRRQKKYSKEVAIIERFAKQKHWLGPPAIKLLERLDKAKELLAAKSPI